MRRIRILALGFVSFFAVLMSALLAPGTFINRALSAALCTVFSFNSTVCTVNLAQSGDRVVAATPLAVERNISDWLVQRTPGEFDDAPNVPSGNNPQAPPFPQDPGPNIIRPEFNDPGSRIDPSLIRPLPPPEVTGKCDFSSVGTSREEQKCFEANGNQCEGGVPFYPPRYNNDTCMVEMYVTPGSTAHDNCCVAHPRGYACDGYGNRNKKEDPSNHTWDNVKSDCEAEWTQARDDLAHDRVYDLTLDGVPGAQRRGYWKEYGPYYSLTGTWIARGTTFTGNDKGCSAGHSGRVTVNGQDAAPGYEFTMTQQGNQITSPPLNIFYSNSSSSGSYTQSSNGTVSRKQVTITTSGGGFTVQGTGIISNDRNTVTGQSSCQFSGGSATATGSFTWTRKK